ncbi:MAG: glycerol-3-phosphate 1-O-acyltransferase PlsY [Clostridiales bacterium]|nr:glycerol-3-phosphate 1-O-acyltransferase PlsY [Clostridiales bacterium]
MYLKFVLAAVFSYLLGSFNTSIVVSKSLAGIDIREYGSKNAGLTNSLRTLGGKKALLVVAGDVAKGGAAILIAYLLFHGYNAQIIAYAKLIAGIFAVTGHVFPVYFNFKGGKGVLTGGSVILFFDWRILLILLTIFLLTYFITKYVSLGSVLAAFALPFLMYYFYQDTLITSVGILISAGLIIMHRSNIKRLINRTESKTNFRKKKINNDNQEANIK